MSATNPVGKQMPTRVADYFSLLGPNTEHLLHFLAAALPWAPADIKGFDETLVETGSSTTARESQNNPNNANVMNNKSSYDTNQDMPKANSSNNVTQPPAKPPTVSPGIIYRFPAQDHEDTEYPKDQHIFAFPKGFEFSSTPHPPVITPYILTEADGTRLFSVALTFSQHIHDVIDQVVAQFDRTHQLAPLPLHSFTLGGSLASTHHAKEMRSEDVIIETDNEEEDGDEDDELTDDASRRIRQEQRLINKYEKERQRKRQEHSRQNTRRGTKHGANLQQELSTARNSAKITRQGSLRTTPSNISSVSSNLTGNGKKERDSHIVRDEAKVRQLSAVVAYNAAAQPQAAIAPAEHGLNVSRRMLPFNPLLAKSIFNLYVPYSITITSHFPFYSALSSVLRQLYQKITYNHHIVMDLHNNIIPYQLSRKHLSNLRGSHAHDRDRNNTTIKFNANPLADERKQGLIASISFSALSPSINRKHEDHDYGAHSPHESYAQGNDPSWDPVSFFDTSHLVPSTTSVSLIGQSTNPQQNQSDQNLGQVVFPPTNFLTSLSSPQIPRLTSLPDSISQWTAPLERFLTNLIYEIPLPPQGRLKVIYNNLICPIVFQRPPPNRLPMRDYSYYWLFQSLSIDNIITIFLLLCGERKVLFATDEMQKLTLILESLSSLLYPLYWRHVFIPLLPVQLTEFICAPMPYMVGVHNSYLPAVDSVMLDQVVLVNLDTNTVELGDVTVPPAPKSLINKLKSALKESLGVKDSANSILTIQPFTFAPEIVSLIPRAPAHQHFPTSNSSLSGKAGVYGGFSSPNSCNQRPNQFDSLALPMSPAAGPLFVPTPLQALHQITSQTTATSRRQREEQIKKQTTENVQQLLNAVDISIQYTPSHPLFMQYIATTAQDSTASTSAQDAEKSQKSSKSNSTANTAKVGKNSVVVATGQGGETVEETGPIPDSYWGPHGCQLINPTTFRESLIENAFLSFWVAVLKNHNEYIFPPEDYFVDRFNTEDFIANSPSELRGFLSELCETQMFACFIEDRVQFQQSTSFGTANYDILYFNETIQRAQGEPTPFLSDTSHNHGVEDDYIVQPVYSQEIQPGNMWRALSASTNYRSQLLLTSYYTGISLALSKRRHIFVDQVIFLYSQLNHYILTIDHLSQSRKNHGVSFHEVDSRFNTTYPLVVNFTPNARPYCFGFPLELRDVWLATPREVKQFVEKENETEKGESTNKNVKVMSAIMRYFADKHLYSQQFHSLLIKSTKQDAFFKEIVRYLTYYQAFQESISLHLADLAITLTPQRKLIKTNTSIDPLYEAMQFNIQQQNERQKFFVTHLRHKVMLPMTLQATEIELTLKNLFAEARKLEYRVGEAKTILERIKTKRESAVLKYNQLTAVRSITSANSQEKGQNTVVGTPNDSNIHQSVLGLMLECTKLMTWANLFSCNAYSSESGVGSAPVSTTNNSNMPGIKFDLSDVGTTIMQFIKTRRISLQSIHNTHIALLFYSIQAYIQQQHVQLDHYNQALAAQVLGTSLNAQNLQTNPPTSSLEISVIGENEHYQQQNRDLDEKRAITFAESQNIGVLLQQQDNQLVPSPTPMGLQSSASILGTGVGAKYTGSPTSTGGNGNQQMVAARRKSYISALNRTSVTAPQLQQFVTDNENAMFQTFNTDLLHHVLKCLSLVEDAAFEYDQSEISFQMLLHEYDHRMPQIIQDIRHFNSLRIFEFKRCMDQWSMLHKNSGKDNLSDIDQISNLVASIDIDTDLRMFHEVTVGPVGLPEPDFKKNDIEGDAVIIEPADYEDEDLTDHVSVNRMYSTIRSTNLAPMRLNRTTSLQNITTPSSIGGMMRRHDHTSVISTAGIPQITTTLNYLQNEEDDSEDSSYYPYQETLDDEDSQYHEEDEDDEHDLMSLAVAQHGLTVAQEGSFIKHRRPSQTREEVCSQTSDDEEFLTGKVTNTKGEGVKKSPQTSPKDDESRDQFDDVPTFHTLGSSGTAPKLPPRRRSAMSISNDQYSAMLASNGDDTSTSGQSQVRGVSIPRRPAPRPTRPTPQPGISRESGLHAFLPLSLLALSANRTLTVPPLLSKHFCFCGSLIPSNCVCQYTQDLFPYPLELAIQYQSTDTFKQQYCNHSATRALTNTVSLQHKNNMGYNPSNLTQLTAASDVNIALYHNINMEESNTSPQSSTSDHGIVIVPQTATDNQNIPRQQPQQTQPEQTQYATHAQLASLQQTQSFIMVQSQSMVGFSGCVPSPRAVPNTLQPHPILTHPSHTGAYQTIYPFHNGQVFLLPLNSSQIDENNDKKEENDKNPTLPLTPLVENSPTTPQTDLLDNLSVSTALIPTVSNPLVTTINPTTETIDVPTQLNELRKSVPITQNILLTNSPILETEKPLDVSKLPITQPQVILPHLMYPYKFQSQKRTPTRNYSIYYPIALWGAYGWSFACQNCQFTKDLAKSMTISLDNLGNAFEDYYKVLINKIYKITALNYITTTTTTSMANSAAVVDQGQDSGTTTTTTTTTLSNPSIGNLFQQSSIVNLGDHKITQHSQQSLVEQHIQQQITSSQSNLQLYSSQSMAHQLSQPTLSTPSAAGFGQSPFNQPQLNRSTSNLRGTTGNDQPNATAILSQISQNTVVLGGVTQHALVDTFRETIRITATAYHELYVTIRKLSFALRIIKGELRSAKQRYDSHKERFDAELSQSTKALVAAQEQEQKGRDRYNKIKQRYDAYMQTSGNELMTITEDTVTVAQIGSNNPLTNTNNTTYSPSPASASPSTNTQQAIEVKELEKIREHYNTSSAVLKEAEQLVILATNENETIRKQRDISVSRLLVLFEQKEKKFNQEVQSILWFLHDWLYAKIVTTTKQNLAMMTTMASAVTNAERDINSMLLTLAPAAIVPGSAEHHLALAQGRLSLFHNGFIPASTLYCATPTIGNNLAMAPYATTTVDVMQGEKIWIDPNQLSVLGALPNTSGIGPIYFTPTPSFQKDGSLQLQHSFSQVSAASSQHQQPQPTPRQQSGLLGQPAFSLQHSISSIAPDSTLPQNTPTALNRAHSQVINPFNTGKPLTSSPSYLHTGAPNALSSQPSVFAYMRPRDLAQANTINEYHYTLYDGTIIRSSMQLPPHNNAILQEPLHLSDYIHNPDTLDGVNRGVVLNDGAIAEGVDENEDDSHESDGSVSVHFPAQAPPVQSPHSLARSTSRASSISRSVNQQITAQNVTPMQTDEVPLVNPDSPPPAPIIQIPSRGFENHPDIINTRNSSGTEDSNSIVRNMVKSHNDYQNNVPNNHNLRIEVQHPHSEMDQLVGDNNNEGLPQSNQQQPQRNITNVTGSSLSGFQLQTEGAARLHAMMHAGNNYYSLHQLGSFFKQQSPSHSGGANSHPSNVSLLPSVSSAQANQSKPNPHQLYCFQSSIRENQVEFLFQHGTNSAGLLSYCIDVLTILTSANESLIKSLKDENKTHFRANSKVFALFRDSKHDDLGNDPVKDVSTAATSTAPIKSPTTSHNPSDNNYLSNVLIGPAFPSTSSSNLKVRHMTMSNALIHFNKTLLALAQFHDEENKIFKEMLKTFTAARTKLRENIKTNEKKIQQVRKEYDVSVSEKDKAQRDFERGKEECKIVEQKYLQLLTQQAGVAPENSRSAANPHSQDLSTPRSLDEGVPDTITTNVSSDSRSGRAREQSVSRIDNQTQNTTDSQIRTPSTSRSYAENNSENKKSRSSSIFGKFKAVFTSTPLESAKTKYDKSLNEVERFRTNLLKKIETLHQARYKLSIEVNNILTLSYYDEVERCDVLKNTFLFQYCHKLAPLVSSCIEPALAQLLTNTDKIDSRTDILYIIKLFAQEIHASDALFHRSIHFHDLYNTHTINLNKWFLLHYYGLQHKYYTPLNRSSVDEFRGANEFNDNLNNMQLLSTLNNNPQSESDDLSMVSSNTFVGLPHSSSTLMSPQTNNLALQSGMLHAVGSNLGDLMLMNSGQLPPVSHPYSPARGAGLSSGVSTKPILHQQRQFANIPTHSLLFSILSPFEPQSSPLPLNNLNKDKNSSPAQNVIMVRQQEIDYKSIEIYSISNNPVPDAVLRDTIDMYKLEPRRYNPHIIYQDIMEEKKPAEKKDNKDDTDNSKNNDVADSKISALAVMDPFNQSSVSITAEYFSHEKCVKDTWLFTRKILTSEVLYLIYSATYYSMFSFIRQRKSIGSASSSTSSSRTNTGRTDGIAEKPTKDQKDDSSMLLTTSASNVTSTKSTTTLASPQQDIELQQLQVGLFIPTQFIELIVQSAVSNGFLHATQAPPPTASITTMHPNNGNKDNNHPSTPQFSTHRKTILGFGSRDNKDKEKEKKDDMKSPTPDLKSTPSLTKNTTNAPSNTTPNSALLAPLQSDSVRTNQDAMTAQRPNDSMSGQQYVISRSITAPRATPRASSGTPSQGGVTRPSPNSYFSRDDIFIPPEEE